MVLSLLYNSSLVPQIKIPV